MRKTNEGKQKERDGIDLGERRGPCCYCGVDSTPQWCVGPEDKPVLCMTCGSRYKKHGSLKDYFLNNVDNGEKPNDRKNLLVSCYLTGERTHLWSPKIPTRKRSLVVYKKLTPMEKFQNQLTRMWKCYGNPKEPSADEVLVSDANNFIPDDEIGLGAVLLKPDDGSA